MTAQKFEKIKQTLKIWLTAMLKIKDKQLLHYASSLSFHTMLSIIPVLLISLSLFTQMPSFRVYYAKIKEFDIRPAAAVKPRGDLKLHRDLFAKQLEPWHPRPWRYHLYFDYVFCRLRIRHQPHHAHEQPQILELAECLLDAHYAGSLGAWA